MTDRIQSHFAERARNARRLALLAAGLAFVSYLSLGLGRVPQVRRALNAPLVRWGFEGPDQYVRRITLDRLPGNAQELRDMGQVLERSTRRGGARTPVAKGARARAEPERRSPVPGPGDSPEDLLARAFHRRSDVPVFQSEELVIEKLVRPAYPARAYDQDIEGRVEVLALVDTTGRVVEVQVVGSDPVASREFGPAASDAVWRCVFRPYRPEGRAREVYAMFRFNFTIN